MKNCFKIFAILLISIVVFNFTGSYVQAAVNTEYQQFTVDTSRTGGENVEDENKETTVGDTIMLYLGRFVFSISKLVESAVKNFSKWLFGVDAFPWEDYIVYNALPYLDINFFNPANGSIFSVGEHLTVGAMIKTVYFSLLTMALSILGIGVAVTAIRLAISTIAAEKAKYKEAITKCLYTVVLLFSVHILISFIFYLNETIVSASSTMLKNLITAQEMAELDDAVNNENIDDNYTFADYNSWPYGANNINPGYAAVKGWAWLIKGGTGAENDDRNEVLGEYNDATSTKTGKAVFAFLIHKMDYVTSRSQGGYYMSTDNNLHHDGLIGSTPGLCVNNLRRMCRDTKAIVESKDSAALDSHFDDGQRGSSWYKYVQEAHKKFVTGEGNEEAVANVISSLGEYFRDRTESILGDKKFNYVALILYSVLMVQSLMLLVNYVKRVFYVTLLAIMAPIVVIYDFFISAI